MTLGAGQRLGMLVLVEYVGNRYWRVRCDCGAECRRKVPDLRKYHPLTVKSCGCWRRSDAGRAVLSRLGMRHGHASRFAGRSGTWRSWRAMIQRCTDENFVDYPAYGGRGIRVCDRWLHSFENFLADMGERPTSKMLDRFPDQNGNYEPGNVRWATAAESAHNRRTNVVSDAQVVEIRRRFTAGERQADLARSFSITPQVVFDIVRYRKWREVAA